MYERYTFRQVKCSTSYLVACIVRVTLLVGAGARDARCNAATYYDIPGTWYTAVPVLLYVCPSGGQDALRMNTDAEAQTAVAVPALCKR